MNSDPSIKHLMVQAVEASIRHVESGGIPFVGLIVKGNGRVSDPGVNLVRETGDPTAHAEIVAMRQTAEAVGATALEGATLLATGEPCALCYQVAADRGVGSVYYAVDAVTAAEWGFDYRAGYTVDNTWQLPLAATAQHLSVDRALEPFTTYQQLHPTGTTDRS